MRRCDNRADKKMLKNAPILAIRGVDTAEIWPSGVWDYRFLHLLPPKNFAIRQPSGTRFLGRFASLPSVTSEIAKQKMT